MSSQAAKIGAHVATLPPNVLRQLFKHALTDKGLKAFLDDWAKTGQIHPLTRSDIWAATARSRRPTVRGGRSS